MIDRKLGIIGAGQLAMLIAFTAKKYNISIMCLDPNKNTSASLYSEILLGEYDDEIKLEELFSKNEFISYEFENIDLKTLKKCINIFPRKCIQNIYPLFFTNNRIREKINLINSDIKTNNFNIIQNNDDLNYFLSYYNKVIIKSSMLGYDGKGQVLINNYNDTKNINIAKNLLNKQECIIEEYVDFKYELSLTGVYYGENNFLFLPLNKNLHQKGILHTSEIFQNTKFQKKSEEIFKKLAIKIKKPSIYTIEFFVTKNNELYVNEIAPRVHNSSHHSINNYNISQFDLFLSLFYDLNLPQLKIINNYILINVLGQHYRKIIKELKSNNKNVIFYDYKKDDPKLNRKMGHLIIDSNEKLLINKFRKLCKI